MGRSSAMLLLLALLLPAVASADEGKVTGKLVIDGKTVKLTHVYALGTTTTSDERFVHVIFSDVAISDPDLLLFPDSLLKAVNADQIHAVRLGIDAHKAVDSVDLFDSSGWTTIKDPNRLELSSFSQHMVTGRLHLDKPYTDMGGTSDYDLKFTVPLRQENELKP